MSKSKKKAADAAVADQAFAGVDLTVKDAASVLLVLQSPEPVVSGKACEALFKHAEKGQQQKLDLFKIGILPALIKLLDSADKSTRYYAMMCVGSLADHPQLQPAIAKEEGAVEKIVRLLGAEGIDLARSVQLLEAGAVHGLVPLLATTECDLQKNAATALSHMTRDYRAREEILKDSGLPSLLNLLESEYREVQQFSLLTLANCSQHPDSRAALRDGGAITKLMVFFENKDFEDLHVPMLAVLANLLRDGETVQAMEDAGELTRLLEIMQTAKDNLVKIQSIRLLAAVARQEAENVDRLHRLHVEKLLTPMLTLKETAVVSTACGAIAALAHNSILCREEFFNQGARAHLLKLMASEEASLREAGVFALAQCLLSRLNCKALLTEGGCTEAVVQMLHDTQITAQLNALSCCTTILSYGVSQWMIQLIECGVIEGLVAVIQGTNIDTSSDTSSSARPLLSIPVHSNPLVAKSVTEDRAVVEQKAAGVLCTLLSSGTARTKLVSCDGAAATLANKLECCHGDEGLDLRRYICRAILLASNSFQFAEQFSHAGGLARLRAVQRSLKSNSSSSLAMSCIKALLEHYPSLKYWLLGSLGTLNITQDGFFVLAQYKGTDQDELPSLEELCKQPVDNSVTVFMVNAVVPDEQKIDDSGDTLSESSRESKSDRGSSRATKPAKKGRASSRVEREAERAREEALAAANRWTMPGDASLVKYLSEVKATVESLPNPKEKAQALAKLISDWMGGAVTSDQLDSLEHHDHVTELKLSLENNAIPIGMVKCGTFLHRAILFKALADRIHLPCTLHRGAQYMAWNVISQVTDKLGDYERHIVDVMHYPGRLMVEDSAEANHYTQLCTAA